VKEKRVLYAAADDGEDWRGIAACRQADAELFFPVSSTGPAVCQIAEAKRICHACPVRTPCLDWALRHGMVYGIWGGTTEDERRAVRKMHGRRAPSMRETPAAEASN
jgi:WhiB family transcriptional regulator, redox-sensing transcriptional regulator